MSKKHFGNPQKKIVQCFHKYDKFYDLFAIGTCKDIEVGQKIVEPLFNKVFSVVKNTSPLYKVHSITGRKAICCRPNVFSAKKNKEITI